MTTACTRSAGSSPAKRAARAWSVSSQPGIGSVGANRPVSKSWLQPGGGGVRRLPGQLLKLERAELGIVDTRDQRRLFCRGYDPVRHG